jgi:hypothetical protein
MAFKFLTDTTINELSHFPKDMEEDPKFNDINHISSGNLFKIYNDEWDRWN